MHYDKDFGIECRIARFHNIFGPYGTWKGGREKAPAAFCRKVNLQSQCCLNTGDGIWNLAATELKLFFYTLKCSPCGFLQVCQVHAQLCFDYIRNFVNPRIPDRTSSRMFVSACRC